VTAVYDAVIYCDFRGNGPYKRREIREDMKGGKRGDKRGDKKGERRRKLQRTAPRR
jgi:hypothetical protein